MKKIVDFRPALPQCRDQGTRKSCLAFAASAAHAHGRKRAAPLSVEYLFYHSVANMPGANPNMGTTLAAMETALVKSGQPDEKVWPYQQLQMTSPNWFPPITSEPMYCAGASIGKLDIGAVCAFLDQGVAVVFGLVTSDSFMQAGPDGMLPQLNPDRQRGGHAVLAVGHGEDAKGERHILIRNSWGTGWGMEGHAWLSSSYLGTQLHETAVIGPTGGDKWN
ncbi:MAG: peptidase C1 [Mesorhizobium sp.]|uniref:C1 family peptidase n=1 Tax=Mesorhizobium sp. TaxID=1871066 RepID=UPI000FE4A58D|nr:C1 family peptidase [Mesorhizobium sp.]RWC33319.1 MAG: peptidase C1 [Mesorhizobium sp.]